MVSVHVENLRMLGCGMLSTVGIPSEQAALVTESLLAADVRGVSSHGFLRLPLYITCVRSGGINPVPEMRWVKDEGATGTLNADCAFGQVAMAAAVEAALEKAKRYGVSAVAVENSTHYGAGAYWTREPLAAGMIAMITSSTGPAMAPYGGAQKILGTNPITFAIPTGGAPIIADIATSAGAYGKIVAAKNSGSAIPSGWAVDAAGNPTTDAAEALDGALLPFGSHKGSALAVIVELLSAGLSNASFARDTVDIWEDPSSQMNTGHFLMLIDSTFFGGRDLLEDKAELLQQRIRGSGESGSPVLSPGDVEEQKSAEAIEVLDLPQPVYEQLKALSAELDVDAAF